MTEKLNTQITIPAWAVSVIVLLFIAYMGFFTAQVKAQQTTQTKVEKIEEDLKLKADQREVDRIFTALDRIEKKIDEQLKK